MQGNIDIWTDFFKTQIFGKFIKVLFLETFRIVVLYILKWPCMLVEDWRAVNPLTLVRFWARPLLFSYFIYPN